MYCSCRSGLLVLGCGALCCMNNITVGHDANLEGFKLDQSRVILLLTDQHSCLLKLGQWIFRISIYCSLHTISGHICACDSQSSFPNNNCVLRPSVQHKTAGVSIKHGMSQAISRVGNTRKDQYQNTATMPCSTQTLSADYVSKMPI